jgi:signal transduction histidine kinase
MNSVPQIEQWMPRTRRAFLLGVGLAMLVLAATIFSGLLLVRALVRQQIVQRDAEALHATTLMEQLDAANLNGNEVRTPEQIGFDAAILASRLRGVLGIRFYDTNGGFRDAFPATILPLPMGPRALAAVRELKPRGRFDPDTPLSAVFIYLPQFATGHVARVPTLEITVPLHRSAADPFAGAAQFIVEGESIAAEYARLDRHLIQYATVTFLIAGTLLVAMLWPAFRRVEKLNRDLAVRSERLQRANEELALAARASAVGAVSAHLMHGLKNPLASLSQFVSQRGPGQAEAGGEDWQDALAASRRMQSLVDQTLEVLADARGEPAYQIRVKELLAGVEQRVAATAARRGVRLQTSASENCVLSSRVANLARLVLVNLLENAIEATPGGGQVSLAVSREDERLRFRECDEGPGFPEHLRPQLFLPCRSTRASGSGIGLAICRRIADHLGATLDLAASNPQGCEFVLELPISVCESAEG